MRLEPATAGVEILAIKIPLEANGGRRLAKRSACPIRPQNSAFMPQRGAL